jgi:hypothetical protein
MMMAGTVFPEKLTLAAELHATILRLGDAIHLTLTPDVVLELAISAKMPITSLPVRDVMSIEGSSSTLKLMPFSPSSVRAAFNRGVGERSVVGTKRI